MISLRNRAVAGGILWAVAMTIGGSFTIGNYVETLAESRFDELLLARHTQVIVALANSTGNDAVMDRQITDPVFQQPFSGYYWEAEREDGHILVSRSMADFLFANTDIADTALTVRTEPGPAGQTVRTASQWLTLGNGSRWVVTVAASTLPLEIDRNELSQRLYYAFALIGSLAIAGILVVVLVTLRPLTKLRKAVAERWDHEGELPEDDYPYEVLPLVQDINQLLARNTDIIGRSRRQTADLAHALKTPSAIMRNELEDLKAHGVNVQASLDALNRLDSQLNRSFARMKATQESASDFAITDIDTSLGRMGRAFTALAKNKDRVMQLDIRPGLIARINQSDLEEIVGNVLDNALKWSTATIRLTAQQVDATVLITVEDDGPGIAKEDRERALSSGQRLDESKPGTGLGLAIASDLVVAYKGTFEIERSASLGGARMAISLVGAQRARRRSNPLPVATKPATA